MSPVGIQRRRTKGWRVPAGTCAHNADHYLKVNRSTRWGNPFGDANRRVAVERFSEWIHDPPELRQKTRSKSASRSLACGCALDRPCHAGIWLKILNP